ncbi:hypothetical protein ACFLZT_02770 [Thermodesulfobacteriota bacterium]
MTQFESFIQLLSGRTKNCLKRYFDIDKFEHIDLDDIANINPKHLLRSGKGCGNAALDEISVALKETGIIEAIDDWLDKRVCPHCGKELEIQNRKGRLVLRAMP